MSHNVQHEEVWYHICVKAMSHNVKSEEPWYHICVKMMSHNVKPEEPWWYHIVSGLPLVDLLVGKHGETFNFEPKHRVKRCWCMFLRDKCN